MEYLIVKWVHVISSTLLFGTGIGSAFYLLVASWRRDPVTAYFVARHVVIADYTTWGWVTLTIGAVLGLTGAGLLVGWGWARWVGIAVAALNCLAQFGSISSFPLWSLMIIALDVVIIYMLCTRWKTEGVG